MIVAILLCSSVKSQLILPERAKELLSDVNEF